MVVAAASALLGGWSLYRGRRVTADVLMVFGALVLVGLVVPVWARRFHEGWMRVASVLGYVNNRILITAVFFLAIVPLGFLARVLGRNRLGRRGVSDATYWVPRPTSRQTREGFERSF
jgi:hypothetical protein